MKGIVFVLSLVWVQIIFAHQIEGEKPAGNPPAETSKRADGRTNESEPLVPNPLKVFLTEEERDHVRSVNKQREARGLPLVAPSLFHMKVAFEHAKDMSSRNYFAHRNSLPGSGSRSENIAAGNAGVDATMAQWMNSSGHRANILNPNAKYIGVGHYWGGNNKYGHYWVQNFSSEPE